MKLLLALALVGLVRSGVAEEEFVAPIERDYHTAIGIPLAARIKAAEKALDFDDARITGGAAADLGKYPYFGGLIIDLSNGNTSICGSSLVSHTRAVTAAHCLLSTKAYVVQLTVVLGSIRLFFYGTRVTTRDFEAHADYKLGYLANDIGIIRFESVTYTNNIYNIEIATGTNQFVRTWAEAVGFGRTGDSSEVTIKQSLRYVIVQVISNDACEATFGSSILPSNLCVATDGGHATCKGDSGGPLVGHDKLIGITSFGHPLTCQQGYPEVFTRVTSFASWIQDRL